MKKLSKLFVLSLCTRCLVFWFSDAQNLIKEYSYTGEHNVNADFESKSWDNESISLNHDIYWDRRCACGMNMLDLFVNVFLFWIKILLWLMLIISLLKTISLYKKLTDTYKHNRLLFSPLLNLYPLSEITIGKFRFFILILLLWFFTYNIYAYKIFTQNNLCCSNPIRQGYSWIIVWICSNILLGVLLSKLSYLIKHPQKDSDKEPTNE